MSRSCAFTNLLWMKFDVAPESTKASACAFVPHTQSVTGSEKLVSLLREIFFTVILQASVTTSSDWVCSFSDPAITQVDRGFIENPSLFSLYFVAFGLYPWILRRQSPHSHPNLMRPSSLGTGLIQDIHRFLLRAF